MAYLQKKSTGLEKRGAWLFKLMARYPKISLAAGGLGALKLYGNARKNTYQLQDWQKDPNLGMNRQYVNAEWGLRD